MSPYAFLKLMYVIIALFSTGLTCIAEAEAQSTNTIIYLMHEDGSYSYHEPVRQKKITYSRQKLSEAKQTSLNCSHCEVFVIRHLAKTRWRKKALILKYSQGRIVARKKYFLESNSFLQKEQQFIRKHSEYLGQNNNRLSLFYFGTTIPTLYLSRNGFDVSIDEFVEGLESLEFPLDLLVISTCQNGADHDFVSRLFEISRHLIIPSTNINLAMLNTFYSDWETENIDDIANDLLTLTFTDMAEHYSSKLEIALYSDDLYSPRVLARDSIFVHNDHNRTK